eukprot:1659173-Rhodomonas_salina.3
MKSSAPPFTLGTTRYLSTAHHRSSIRTPRLALQTAKQEMRGPGGTDTDPGALKHEWPFRQTHDINLGSSIPLNTA